MKTSSLTWLALLVLVSCEETAPPSAGPTEESSARTRWATVRPSEGLALGSVLADVEGTSTARGADITTPHPGRVRALLAAPGDVVTADAPIAEVYVPELSMAAAGLSGLRDEVRVLNARVQQLETLTAEGLARADELLQARQALATARSRLDTSTALLRAASIAPRETGALLRRGYVVLRSPVDGVVLWIAARVGSPVTPQTPLARIAGTGPVRVVARTPSALPEGRPKLRTDGGDVPLRPVGSPVRDSNGLWVGFFEPVGITPLRDGERWPLVVVSDGTSLVIPVTSLLQRRGRRAEVVRRRQGDLERVEVEVLHADGARATIRGELRDGDEVAVEPALLAAEGER